MIRRLMRAMAAGALVAAAVPGVASAAAPVGECPNGEAAAWILTLPIHQPQPLDHNGDGWLCVKYQKDGSFAFHDNVTQP